MRGKTGYLKFSDDLPRKTGYTRISKSEIEGRDTLNRHFEELKKAGATEVYWDVISRSSKKREGLSQVFWLIENRQTSEIILLRLDRLTDSLTLFEQFIDLIESSGIPCRGLHDNIDLTTVGGRTHARLLVTFSRNEIERTSQRFKSGWEHVRRRKKAVNPPFGYTIHDDKHALDHRPFVCLIDSQQEYSRAAIARLIIDFFLEEKTLTKTVARMNQYFGLWHSNFSGTRAGFTAAGGLRISTSGLSLWLTSPVLRGGLVYFRGEQKEEIYWDSHEDALLTQAEFSEIEIIMQKNREQKGYSSKQTHPLSGLVVCAECGGTCYSCVSGKSGTKKKSYNYYYCKNAKVKACSNSLGMPEPVIEQAVISALVAEAELITAIAISEQQPQESPQEKQIKQKIAAIESLINNGNLTADFILKDAIAKLQAELRSLQGNIQGKEYHRDLILAFAEENYWQTLLTDEKIILYRKLVKSVKVLNKAVVSVELR